MADSRQLLLPEALSSIFDVWIRFWIYTDRTLEKFFDWNLVIFDWNRSLTRES